MGRLTAIRLARPDETAGRCRTRLNRRASLPLRMTKWKQSDADEVFHVRFRAAANAATCGLATLAALSSVLAAIAITVPGGGCGRPASPVTHSSTAAPAPATIVSARPRSAENSMTGGELYLRHCSPCHGLDGDGQGVATRFLLPKPRNFRTSKFRLVSSLNGVPTSADLDAVLIHGISGTAMPSFRHLEEASRGKVISEVSRLRREGVRESVVHRLQEEYQEDDIDPEELRKMLDCQLAPGAAASAPPLGQATGALLRQGREIYIKQNCPRCHGGDGNGDTGLYLADEEGYPTRPRNLVREEFKGGHEPASISVRIRLGLPGTPMAANPNLSEQELVALVHYCRSLAREPKWQLTNHQRAKRVLDRGYLSPGHSTRW